MCPQENSIWTLSLWLGLCHPARHCELNSCHRLTTTPRTEHLLFEKQQHSTCACQLVLDLVIGVLFIFRVSMLPASLCKSLLLYWGRVGRVDLLYVCLAASVSRSSVRTWIFSRGNGSYVLACSYFCSQKGQQPLQGQVYWKAPSLHRWSRLDARWSYANFFYCYHYCRCLLARANSEHRWIGSIIAGPTLSRQR